MENQPEEKKSWWRRETWLTLTARWVIVAVLAYYVLKFFMPQTKAFVITLVLIAVVIAASIYYKRKFKKKWNEEIQ